MNLIKIFIVLLFLLGCNLSKAQDFHDSPLFYLSGDTIKIKPGLSIPTFATDIDITGMVESTNYINKSPTTLGDGIIDCSLNNLYTLYVDYDIDIVLTNMPDNKWITIFIENDQDWTISWPIDIKWPSSTPPTLTIGGKTDVYSFIQINSVIYGSAVQNY